MNFLIADTFTDSLAKLTGNEQKAVKTTAFDLQINPSQPGLSFHKLEKVRDPNFWSVRVSRDIRIIVHRSQQSLVLCYVDHHDDAYQWAERRKLETHPKNRCGPTGGSTREGSGNHSTRICGDGAESISQSTTFRRYRGERPVGLRCALGMAR